MDVLIGFLFQGIEAKASEQGKVMVKDCKEEKLAECLQATSNLV